MEEAARFVLDDTHLATELKNLRHRLSPKDPTAKNAYLDARDAASDIGAATKPSTKEPVRHLSQAVVANARRAEESLRVLEELAKTTGTGLDGAEFQSARFAVYTLEKTLLARLMRLDRAALICGLHAIVGTVSLGTRPPAEIACEMLQGGARIILLHGKTTPRLKFLDIALRVAELCREYKALFIMSEALDIALAVNADGLHLSQDDLPVIVARRLLPTNQLIGRSVRSVTEARQAHADGADYLSCEAVFTTGAEPERSAPSCALLAEIKKEVNLPLIATGDITQYNVTDVLRSGADGVAVASALTNAHSVKTATQDIIKALEVSCEPAK